MDIHRLKIYSKFLLEIPCLNKDPANWIAPNLSAASFPPFSLCPWLIFGEEGNQLTTPL